MSKLYCIVIAAGKGTRMQSEHSKLVQKIYDKEMVKRVVETAVSLKADKIIGVVGYKKEEVQNALKGINVDFAIQEEQLGTGHAVMQAIPFIDEPGKVVILYGDVPLLRKETISNLINSYEESNSVVSIMTAEFKNPTGYGRILRDSFGNIFDIREEKDCSEEERKITEINAGIYCFDSEKLKYALTKITNENSQNEYYLTDTIRVLADNNDDINTYKIYDNTELLGVNDRVQLEIVTNLYKSRIDLEHMKNGVTIEDVRTTYIEDNVQIGKDTVIKPGTVIKKGTVIGQNCHIGYNVYISENKIIKDGTIIEDNTIM